jgi:hypothetical protein
MTLAGAAWSSADARGTARLAAPPYAVVRPAYGRRPRSPRPWVTSRQVHKHARPLHTHFGMSGRSRASGNPRSANSALTASDSISAPIGVWALAALAVLTSSAQPVPDTAFEGVELISWRRDAGG